VTPTVTVDDAQASRTIDIDRWTAFASAVLVGEGLANGVELSLRFVSEDEIARLNEEYLGHVGATDVLSFPIEDDPYNPSIKGSAPLLLGDVVICPEVAFHNAPDHAGTYDAEIALLIVHGILHVLGMDHEVDEEADVMEERERSILSSLSDLTRGTP
jgi:probable rRNA maturation factor